MTDKTAVTHEYFEFSKVKRPSLRQTVFLIVMLVGTAIAGLYYEPSYGYVLVFIPFFAVALFCDYSGITFRDTPRLKTLQSVLTWIYVLSGMAIVGYSRETGFIYEHILKPLL
jgi:hypothetical protein